MEELHGTKQDVKYVWQARKSLAVHGGRAIQQGETFTPTEEMIAAFRDLMVPVGNRSARRPRGGARARPCRECGPQPGARAAEE